MSELQQAVPPQVKPQSGGCLFCLHFCWGSGTTRKTHQGLDLHPSLLCSGSLRTSGSPDLPIHLPMNRSEEDWRPFCSLCADGEGQGQLGLLSGGPVSLPVWLSHGRMDELPQWLGGHHPTSAIPCFLGPKLGKCLCPITGI